MKKTKQQEPEITVPEPPEHLSERSRELWITLAPTEARSLERRTLFLSALEALDTADAARHIVQAEGLTSTTASTGVVHLNPAVKVEREARAQFVRIWDMLGLRHNSRIDRSTW
ncbi:MAG: hypothetical protein IPM24_26940 [Bryobacterales bacterium]|nr:hypothetical protein [Bryobacterales bacterium]